MISITINLCENQKSPRYNKSYNTKLFQIYESLCRINDMIYNINKSVISRN